MCTLSLGLYAFPLAWYVGLIRQKAEETYAPVRDSPKLGYPRFRGRLQTTPCWRYPYGVHRFPQGTVRGNSSVPQRQLPPALYGTYGQRTRARRTTACRTRPRLEPGDYPQRHP